MADDIRTLSAELARDPSSPIYVALAEALRRRGHSQEALQAAMHGLGRHPDHADGYDVLARIHADRGELDEARSAWERALAIVPEHVGALKGLGFLFYRQGEVRKAIEALEHAILVDRTDDQTRRALAMVRGEPAPAVEPVRTSGRLTPEDVPQLRATAGSIAAPPLPDAPTAAGRPTVAAELAPPPPPPPPVPPAPAGVDARPAVFAGYEGATADILLLEQHGLVLAGGLRAPDGADVSELAAAALAGVSGEAERASGYLRLGAWGAIVAEADQANVVLAPVEGGAMLMVRRERSTPVGLAIRIAERARATARQWLAGQGL